MQSINHHIYIFLKQFSQYFKLFSVFLDEYDIEAQAKKIWDLCFFFARTILARKRKILKFVSKVRIFLLISLEI